MEPLTIKSLILLSGCAAVLCIALGFNTIDQMIVRYKYYNYWRNLDTWEMCPFWSPNWWNIYILSVVLIALGGIFLGINVALVIKQ